MRENVLATLAYYDVLDFPLKTEEVFRYLVKQQPLTTLATLAEVQNALDQLVLEHNLDRRGEYYFLFAREYLVPLRIKRAKISRQKWQRACAAIAWLKFIPFVRAVFASGSLALGNCDELSDLDVLVVTKHGRIWLTRFWITAWLSVLRLRRQPHQTVAPDKVCLNHYITDQSLTIPFAGLYTAQNYINLRPLLVKDPKIVEEFVIANQWINQFVASPWSISAVAPETVTLDILSRGVVNFREKLLAGRLGKWLENKAKQFQIKKITGHPPTQLRGHVVYADSQLAFHPDSPEQGILEQYHSRLQSLLGS